jgi:hypothetical protein
MYCCKYIVSQLCNTNSIKLTAGLNVGYNLNRACKVGKGMCLCLQQNVMKNWLSAF